MCGGIWARSGRRIYTWHSPSRPLFVLVAVALGGSRQHMLELIVTRVLVLAPIFVLGFSEAVVNAYIPDGFVKQQMFPFRAKPVAQARD